MKNRSKQRVAKIMLDELSRRADEITNSVVMSEYDYTIEVDVTEDYGRAVRRLKLNRRQASWMWKRFKYLERKNENIYFRPIRRGGING